MRRLAYQEDDTTVIRASAIGGCLRAIAADLQGYTPMTPPKKMEEVFEAGHLYEPLVLDHFGLEEMRQAGVALMIRPGLEVRGHIDAMHDGHVIEVKSVSPRIYQGVLSGGLEHLFGVHPRYRWQTSCYMHGMVAPLKVHIVERQEDGTLDPEKIRTFALDFPEIPLAWIHQRAEQVIAAVFKEELPACEPMYPCPFFYLHDEEPVEIDAEVDALAVEYERVRLAEQRAKAMKTELRERLLLTLGEREKVATGQFSVSKFVQNRKRLNEERVREAGIDLSEFYDPYTVPQLRVTRRSNDSR